MGLRLQSQNKRIEIPYDITVLSIEHDTTSNKYCIYGTVYNITVLLARYSSLELAHEMLSDIMSNADMSNNKHALYRFPKEKTVIRDRKTRERQKEIRELQLKERM